MKKKQVKKLLKDGNYLSKAEQTPMELRRGEQARGAMAKGLGL